MHALVPDKLRVGDEIRVIAPSRSLALLSDETIALATNRLTSLGFKVTFGEHVKESDEYVSSSRESRISDLHAAFANPNVKGILTVIGGFNSNQLLPLINWELLRQNPKVFCGFSDITILNNSIFAKTGLVTYSGPHFSTFGQKVFDPFTQEAFVHTVMEQGSYVLPTSTTWTDDMWWMNQDDRHPLPNPGWQVVRSGTASGTLLGANLDTFHLLQGTPYMPSLNQSILFLEDDAGATLASVDRRLESLMQHPEFSGVKGMVWGRFQQESHISPNDIATLLLSKPALANMPLVIGLDFGHTEPKVTLPIGGQVEINAATDAAQIQILSL